MESVYKGESIQTQEAHSLNTLAVPTCSYPAGGLGCSFWDAVLPSHRAGLVWMWAKPGQIPTLTKNSVLVPVTSPARFLTAVFIGF
jgi:hypothetical protein